MEPTPDRGRWRRRKEQVRALLRYNRVEEDFSRQSLHFTHVNTHPELLSVMHPKGSLQTRSSTTTGAYGSSHTYLRKT